MPAPRTALLLLLSLGLPCAVLSLVGCGPGEARHATGPTGSAGPTVVEDLSGQPLDPLANGNRANVLLFVRTDCPIGNRYAPEIHRLRARFAADGVGLWLVYPDPSEDAAMIEKHLADYGFGAPALRDPQHVLVAATGATVTPEAAVFDASRRLLYHGRIDDRHVDFGLSRPAATSHELVDAVTAHLAGLAPPASSEPAVGCFIPELR